MNIRILSGILIILLIFSACSGNSAPIYDNERLESSELILDKESESVLTSYEYPGILDEVSFEGQAVMVSSNKNTAPKTNVKEVRAVWISYLEMDTMLKGKTQAQFIRNISSAFDNISDFGFNTVIVQVRPFGDALYESDYFPWSYIASGTEGKNPGFDPLEIMVSEAKARSLKIEAWINPYRVRPSGNSNALAAANPAAKWLSAKDSSVIKYNGVISYNPASTKAQELIVNGVREIVKKYDVDGIHIDDYFYPTTDSDFDKASYNSYKKNGGKLGLADWRRSNVETLLKKMYKAIKAENKNVLFGISPQSNIDTNYNVQYLDVKKITGTTGYCDYVCPQIYFGFNNDTQPFEKTLGAWNGLVKSGSVSLYVGIAAYKVGSVDTWAGSGSDEWVDNQNMLSKMVKSSRSASNCSGFIAYRYDNLFPDTQSTSAHIEKEKSNLKAVMN